MTVGLGQDGEDDDSGFLGSHLGIDLSLQVSTAICLAVTHSRDRLDGKCCSNPCS